MKKIIIFILVGCLYFGCERKADKSEKDESYKYDRICIEGHIYFRWFRDLAIKLDDNGNPIKCK